MNTKHTPLPWFVGSPIRNEDTIGICHTYREQDDECEETITEVLPGCKQEQMEADAKFIVKACNHHDELVNAVKNLLDSWPEEDRYEHDTGCCGADEGCAICRANQLLTAIEKD